MGTLRLGNAKFLHGCIGINLDYLARQAFWERGLDFNHGTGHGVGYLLNVHERPNGFRWKMVPERMENAVLEEGMLTSDEPGIYIEGSHGIRTENLMLCRKAEKNMYGQFMRFEFVTMVPIDLDGIDTQYMTCLLYTSMWYVRSATTAPLPSSIPEEQEHRLPLWRIRFRSML